MKTVSKILWLVPLSLWLGVLSGCAPDAAPTPGTPTADTPEKTTLTVLTPIDTPTLDPAVNSDFSGSFFLLNVYERLVAAEGSTGARIIPQLAERWETSADGKVYTFHLRQGARFHDGTPVDAAAVKFSFERLIKMNQGSVANFTSIDTLEVVDPATVQFKLKAPFSSFLSTLTSLWGPCIVSPTAVKAHEKDNDLGAAWLAEHEAGSGPYQLGSWVRNQQLTLVRDPNYWGGWRDQYLEKILLRFVPETTTMRLLLEKGDADIVVGMSSNEDLDALATTPGIRVEEAAALSIRDLRINSTKKPLDDVRVRQALAYSFDYEDAVSGILDGHGKRMTSITAAGVPGYYSPSFIYTQDKAKAKKLLADAGYPNGGFSLPYVWLSGFDIDRQIGEMWQADLVDLGIDLKIQEMPLDTYWEISGNAETAPELMMGQWGLDYADATSQIWAMYYSGNFPPNGANYFYKNEKVDELLKQARVEIDATRRNRLYQQAVEIIYTDSPEIWTLQTNERIALRTYVTGYQYNLSYYKEGINFARMHKE